jgi:hypothetical protein
MILSSRPNRSPAPLNALPVKSSLMLTQKLDRPE